MASMKQNDSDYPILNEEWGKKLYKPLTQRVYACDSFTNEIYCALKLLGKWDICSYKLFILFRADCSEADIPGNSPVHNGLTQFGRVSSSDYIIVRIGVMVFVFYFNWTRFIIAFEFTGKNFCVFHFDIG